MSLTACSRKYISTTYNAPFHAVARPAVQAAYKGSFLHCFVRGRSMGPYKEVIVPDTTGARQWTIRARVLNFYTIRIRERRRHADQTVLSVRGQFYLWPHYRLPDSEQELLHEIDSFVMKTGVKRAAIGDLDTTRKFPANP